VEVTSYEGQSPKWHRFKAKGQAGEIVVYSTDSLEVGALYALSLLLRRPQEKLHLITVSAFMSLLLRPTLLFNLSFLMSYTAVTFIVLSLKPLKTFEPKNKLLRYLYYLIGVSLAAQLGVSPISLVVFKEFSYWFLIGSVLLIPLMPSVLLLGIYALTGEWGATICQYFLSLLFKGID
jgi:ComEC/Rec2-related protein